MRRPRSGRLGTPGRRARPGPSRRLRPAVETLEGRLVLDAGLADVAILSATTVDSRSVAVHYALTLPDPAPGATVEVAFFRSADPQYSAADDIRLDAAAVRLDAGEHTVTVALPATLAIDPAHPYVLAVADLPGAIAEADEGNNAASFRIFTIGAVAHGFELFPDDSAWVDVMARSLERAGYDVGLAFHWDALSFLPIPGMTSLAGLQLAGAVSGAVAALAPRADDGDVIALHLIGHSRGSVVISQAAQDLEFFEQISPALAPLKSGPLKLTFLDPHPASNVYSATLYSAAPNLLGTIGAAVYHAVQAAMNDPNVVVPASADWAEVYYQRTSYTRGVTPIETFFLLWGQNAADLTIRAPGMTAVTAYDLTDTPDHPGVPGHYLVHDWYQANVVPTLGAPTAPALADTVVMAGAGAMATAGKPPGPFVAPAHLARPDGPPALDGIALLRARRRLALSPARTG